MLVIEIASFFKLFVYKIGSVTLEESRCIREEVCSYTELIALYLNADTCEHCRQHIKRRPLAVMEASIGSRGAVRCGIKYKVKACTSVIRVKVLKEILIHTKVVAVNYYSSVLIERLRLYPTYKLNRLCLAVEYYVCILLIKRSLGIGRKVAVREVRISRFHNEIERFVFACQACKLHLCIFIELIILIAPHQTL